MTTPSILSSISLLTSTRTGSSSASEPSTTASFTLTISESATLGTISSKSNSDTSGATSSSTPTSTASPTITTAQASVVTVEVASDHGNDNDAQSYPIGLILGIVTGFCILIVVMGVMFLILWRHRQHHRGDEGNELLSMHKKKKWLKSRAGEAGKSRPLRKMSVDSNASEEGEAPLSLSPSPRRISKQQPGSNRISRREARNGANMRGWPLNVGTSVVPMLSPRDPDGQRHAEHQESYRPYRSNDTTLVRSPHSAMPMMSLYRPPLSHRNLPPFSPLLPPEPEPAVHPSQARRSSHPEVSTKLDPLGMNPPSLRIITPGSAIENHSNHHHHHYRSRSSNDIASAARSNARPPAKQYMRQFSRRLHYQQIDPEQQQPGHSHKHIDSIDSFIPAPLSKVTTDSPSTTTTGSNSRSGHRPRSSEPDSMSPHSRSCSGEFFELSPPPRQRQSALLLPPDTEIRENNSNNNDTIINNAQQQRLSIGGEGGLGGAGRINRGSGLRISGVSQMAPVDHLHNEGDDGDNSAGRRGHINDETFLRV